jgi:hypothetical protein
MGQNIAVRGPRATDYTKATGLAAARASLTRGERLMENLAGAARRGVWCWCSLILPDAFSNARAAMTARWNGQPAQAPPRGGISADLCVAASSSIIRERI